MASGEIRQQPRQGHSKRISYVSRDDTLRLWDVESQTEIAQLGNGDQTYPDAAFLPDGLIVSASVKYVRLGQFEASLESWRLPKYVAKRWKAGVE